MYIGYSFILYRIFLIEILVLITALRLKQSLQEFERCLCFWECWSMEVSLNRCAAIVKIIILFYFGFLLCSKQISLRSNIFLFIVV